MGKHGTAAVGRGARGRGARSARRSAGSEPSSPAVRGRPRRAPPAEDAAVDTLSDNSALAVESSGPAPDAGRRVSRRQRMPNKRLMPITNGRAEPAPTATPRAPTRGARRTRSAPAAGRAGRGRRRAAPEPGSPGPAAAGVNGVMTADFDEEDSQPLSRCTVKLLRAELPVSISLSDAESRDTGDTASEHSSRGGLTFESQRRNLANVHGSPDADRRVSVGENDTSAPGQRTPPAGEQDTSQDAATDRESSPDSLVRFRDPSAPERSLGDSMDLDSTLEEIGDSGSTGVGGQPPAVAEPMETAEASVKTASLGSEDAPEAPSAVQEPMDCSTSPAGPVDPESVEAPSADSCHQEPAARDSQSPVPGAMNGQNPLHDTLVLRTPPPEALDSPSPTVDAVNSRSPTADARDSPSPAVDAQDELDSRSPPPDGLDSRSPRLDVAESSDGSPSPAPPPDPDDNACSLPSVLSKTTSDSEDSRNNGSLASLPPPENMELTEKAEKAARGMSVIAEVVPVSSPLTDVTPATSSPVEVTPMPSPPADIGRAPSPVEVTPATSMSPGLVDGGREVSHPPEDGSPPSVRPGSPVQCTSDVTSPPAESAPDPVTSPAQPSRALSPVQCTSDVTSPSAESAPDPVTSPTQPVRASSPVQFTSDVTSPPAESAPDPVTSPTQPARASSPVQSTSDVTSPPAEAAPDAVTSPTQPARALSSVQFTSDVTSPPAAPTSTEPERLPASNDSRPPSSAENVTSPSPHTAKAGSLPSSSPNADRQSSDVSDPAPSPPSPQASVASSGGCSPLNAYSDDDDEFSELWPLPPSLGRPVAPPSVEEDSLSTASDDRPSSPPVDGDEADDRPPSAPGTGHDDGGLPTPLDERLRSLDVRGSPAGQDVKGNLGAHEEQSDVEMRSACAAERGGVVAVDTVRRSDRSESPRSAAKVALDVSAIPLPADPAAASPPTDMELSTPDGSADEADGAPAAAAPSPPARHCSVESGDRASPFMGLFDEDDSPFVVRPADQAPPTAGPSRRAPTADEEAGPSRPVVSYSARRSRPPPPPAAMLLPAGSIPALRGLSGSLPIVAQSQLAAAAPGAVITSSRPVMVRSDALMGRAVADSALAATAAPPNKVATAPLSNRTAVQPNKSAAQPNKTTAKANKVASQSNKVSSKSGKSSAPSDKSGAKSGAARSSATASSAAAARSGAAAAQSLTGQSESPGGPASARSGTTASKQGKTGQREAAGTPPSQRLTPAASSSPAARASKPKAKLLERLSSGSPSSPKRSSPSGVSPSGAGGKSTAAAAAASPQAERRGQLLDDSVAQAVVPLPLDIPLPPSAPAPGPGRQPTAAEKAAKAETKSSAKLEPSTLDKQKYKDSRIDAIKDKDINKLRKFKTISDSIWLKKQKLTKQQKEARHMVCDCYLSPEEMERGDMGCGEDCLNRLLMIECGSRCPLGDRCSNKRFTRKETHPTSVFKTELKGYGLRADVDMPENAFIYEYVGEVLDAEEFKRRTKEYDRLKYHHYYFMALKGDAIIDATEKGNASRFINHSCDPNSETQKWTVNGELRIGFFTRRPVVAGEEITFDYQLQRYGKEAQKCFCGSTICRGWIGEKTDEDVEDEDEEDEEEEEAVGDEPEAEAGVAPTPDEPGAPDTQGQPAGPPRPPKVTKHAKRRRDAEKRDLEIEINKLVASGLKSKQHTLELSRLMVRAESEAERLTLLELICTADQPCRRLFLDYHGLRLLWSWMASAAAPQGPADDGAYRFRRKVLETLATLPIPNKTCLSDSRVLGAVERWATAGQPATPCTPDTDTTPSDTADTPATAAAATAAAAAAADCPAAAEVAELAAHLLESWSGLQEVFRIPKKERVEIMREHEKEADRGYQTYLQQHPRPSRTSAKKGYDWSPERRKRARDSPELELRVKKYRPFVDRRLTKEERRQLFMLEVQREEEERRQRQQQQELWRGHEQRCAMLGLDPHLTPIFDPSYQYYWEPSAGAWQPYTPGDPSVPLVPALGVDPLHVAALPQQLAVYQGMAAVDPARAEQYLEQVAQQRAAVSAVPPDLPLDGDGLPAGRPGLLELIQSQLPGRFLSADGSEIALSSLPVPDSGGAYRLACYNDPSLPNVSIGNIPLPERAPPGQPPPPPPPPPEPVITLPPRWRLAKDDDDRIYFYHQVTRETRWTPPVSADWIPPPGAVTTQQTIWTAGSSTESSPADGSDGSSSSSDSDSSSSSEDEGKPGQDEEEDAVSSELPEDMAKEEEIDRRRMVDQHRRRRGKRRDRLVQERVISPVPEMSRQELRRERHRQKRQAKAEARRERRLDPSAAPRGPRPRRRRPAPPPPEPPEVGAEAALPGAEAEPESEPAAEQEQPEPEPDSELDEGARKAKEEKIRKFKAKEEALRKHQAKKQEAERRKRKAAAAAAAASASSSKKRKVEVKRVSSSSSSSTSAAATASSGRKEKPTTAAADTSSEVARKIKDKFLAQMSGVIVSALNVFRKSGCKQGRITTTEDFKFLAKKLTHHVMVKELKNVQQVEELTASDSVKHKAKYYVRKYMGRFGETYSRDAASDEPEPAEPAH